MGHYASEMAYHTRTPPTPEELVSDREERKADRQYKWNLWNQYREQGDSPGRFDDKAACPECCAPIKFEDMPDHDDWHKTLKIQSIIGPGLF